MCLRPIKLYTVALQQRTQTFPSRPQNVFCLAVDVLQRLDKRINKKKEKTKITTTPKTQPQHLFIIF